MTRPLRSSSDASAGYTRLERAVFRALAAELAAQVPDLARQVAASRLTVRKNSGFGVFTELSTSPSPSWARTAGDSRSGWGNHAPATNISGDLGSVHAVLSGLRDPVRFTARLQHGRLVGLMGDSYGQDTRHIDFAAVHVAQLFIVDASGRSIPVADRDAAGNADQRAATPRPKPQAEPQPRTASLPTTPQIQPPQRPGPARSVPATPSGSSGEREAAPALADLLGLIFRPGRATLDDARSDQARPDQAARTDRTSLLIGLWVVLGAGVILAELIFDIPWLLGAIAAFWIGVSLSKPKALAALQKGLDAWAASRAGR